MKNKKNKFGSDFENNDLNTNIEVNEFDESFDENSNGDFDLTEKNQELSREEKKMIRATKRKGIDRSKLDPYDKSDLAEAKRYAKKNKATVFFVFMTIILLLAIIVTVSVVLIIRAQGGPSKANYEVTVGDEDPYKLNYKEANKYGQFYFDLKSIAKYAGLIVSGSDGNIKFTCEDGTYVRLENGESIAVVNGETVKVGGKAYVQSPTDKSPGECLLPFKFIEKLFSHKANGKAVGMVFKGHHNWALYGAMIGSFLLTTAVVEIDFLSNLFGFTHLNMTEYLISLGLAFLIIPLVEIIKFFQKKFGKPHD